MFYFTSKSLTFYRQNTGPCLLTCYEDVEIMPILKVITVVFNTYAKVFITPDEKNI